MSMKKNLQFRIDTADGVPSAPIMHAHGTYDLYYMESGHREYFVEDKFFTAAAGDFVLIKPSSFHRIGQGQVLRTLISFTEDFLACSFSPDAIGELLTCFEKPLITPPQGYAKDLQQLLKELKQATAPLTQGVLLARLLLLLNSCDRIPAYDLRISAILTYINHNFAQIKTIDQIAAAMYLSKQHLCRLFKKATGMTLIEYLNRIRVQNACRLLEQSDKTLLQICQLCGFGTSAYFSTVFKANTGLTPLQYRRTHQ